MIGRQMRAVGDILWTDMLKAELSTSLRELDRKDGIYDTNPNTTAKEPIESLGVYDEKTDRAVVFLDNVWESVIEDGVTANDIDDFIQLLIDVDTHEVTHQAMASEMQPRYNKFEKELKKLVKDVDVNNFVSSQKELKRLVGDYTEMLFMEELFAYSSEKNLKYSELKDNYDMMGRIEDMVEELLRFELKPIQRNLANVIGQEAERKWNFLTLTFKNRILRI